MKRDFAVAVKTVIIKENQALCLFRSDKEIRSSRLNSVDLCDLPGGGLQYFEKMEDGLHREVREETSLKVNIIKPLDAHDIIRPALHIIFVTYLSEYLSGEVVLSDEHKGYQWVGEDEIDGLNMQKWLKRIYKKAFAEHRIFSGTM